MLNNLVVQVLTAVIGLAIGMVAWNTGVSAVNLLTDWIKAHDRHASATVSRA